MNNAQFWESINRIIDNDFTEEDLTKLEIYGELFFRRKLIFKRFSPSEQLGCAEGGSTHVIASILSRAEAPSNIFSKELSDFKRELKLGTYQAKVIEKWAKATGIWIDNIDLFLTNHFGEPITEGGEAKVYDNGPTLIKSIGLDYFILPSLALDRITLHNAFFRETRLTVIGFGRDKNDEFKIIVEQPFIEGEGLTEEEIEKFVNSLGFSLQSRSSWTYTTPYIYLSDMHDENIIKSSKGNIYVIDCDIRLNTPVLKLGGIREDTNEVEFLPD